MTYQEVTQNQIDNIMDNFDFLKVYNVMKFLNWEWYTFESSSGVNIPDVSQLRTKALELLNQVILEKGSFIETGGFRVTRTTSPRKDDKWVRLELTFNIESWDPDGETYE